MKSQLYRAIERQRETNKPIHPMQLITTLISTQKGWLIRQTIKWVTIGGAMATSWLAAHNVQLDNPEAVTAALVTLTTGVIEMLLSKAASKIAAK